MGKYWVIISSWQGKDQVCSWCKRGPGKAGPAAFSGEQLWEPRKLLVCITDLRSLVLVANLEFMLAAQNQLGLLWIAFPNSKFWWIRARLKKCLAAVLRLCSCSSPLLLYPVCAGAGLFSVWWCLGWHSCDPASCEPVCPQGPWRCGRKQWSLHQHFLRTASHQGCSLKEQVDFMRVIMSYDLIKPIQSFLSAVSFIQMLQLSLEKICSLSRSLWPQIWSGS